MNVWNLSLPEDEQQGGGCVSKRMAAASAKLRQGKLRLFLAFHTSRPHLRTALWRVSGAELGTAGAFSRHSHVPGRYRLKEVPVCRSCASVYRILHDARSLGARHVEKREASPSFFFPGGCRKVISMIRVQRKAPRG